MNLTQQSFIRSQFSKSEVQQNRTGFSALGITSWKQAGLSSCLETLGGKICFPSYFGCCQNLIPCGCRTEVLVSLLAASQRSLSAKQRLPTLLITGASTTREGVPNSSQASDL